MSAMSAVGRLICVRIVNCFGFRDTGDVAVADAKNLVYVLGRNSSGKTALLTAIEALFSDKPPTEWGRFENFDSTGAPPSLQATFTGVGAGIVAQAIGSDLFSAVMRVNPNSQPHHGSQEFGALGSAIANAIEPKYSELMRHFAGSNATFVRRTAAGDYELSSDPDFGDIVARRNGIQREVNERFRAVGGVFSANDLFLPVGGSNVKIQLPTAQQLENVLFSYFPKAQRFDQRSVLVEDVPSVIHQQHLSADSGILGAFLNVLGRDDISRFLATRNSEVRDLFLKAMQERATQLCDEVNAASRGLGRQELIGIRLAERGGLQVMVKTDGKPSDYAHISENTKILFAYFLLLRADKADANILLFDEPNNGFHATAQEELLRFLKLLAQQGKQVIVSTHSEHLIDLDHLTGVRLMTIDTNPQYLAVRNKWNVATQGPGDVEAFRPVRDAIGLTYGASHLTVTDKLVVTEGLTDMLYLRAFCRIFGRDELHIMPANGDKSIIPVVSLLIGQQLSFKVVVDTSRGKTARDHLVQAYDVPLASVFQIPIPSAFPNVSGSGIEDVFSKADFKRILTEMGSPPDPAFGATTNNEYLRDPTRVRKRIVANWFLQHANAFTAGDFDGETRGNVEALLDFCANSDWCSF